MYHHLKEKLTLKLQGHIHDQLEKCYHIFYQIEKNLHHNYDDVVNCCHVINMEENIMCKIIIHIYNYIL